MKATAPLVMLAEKVISTYVQALVALLLLHETIGASTLQVAAIAAVPAALTALVNGLPTVPLGLPFWVDLVFRTGRTYLVSFIGLLVANPTFHLNFTVAVAASVSALPSALAVAKGALAKKFGDGTTAALVPAAYDTSQLAVPLPA